MKDPVVILYYLVHAMLKADVVLLTRRLALSDLHNSIQPKTLDYFHTLIAILSLQLPSLNRLDQKNL